MFIMSVNWRLVKRVFVDTACATGFDNNHNILIFLRGKVCSVARRQEQPDDLFFFGKVSRQEMRW